MNAPAQKLRPVETDRDPQPVEIPTEQPATDEATAPEAAEAAPERPRRRMVRRIAIVALPLALAVGGGYAWVTGGRYVSTEDAYVQQDRVTIMPQVSGDIATVNAGENETVAAGDVLFSINDAIYRNAVEAARARLASARLGVEKLKTAYHQAVSAAATAQDALETAQTQNQRQEALLKRGVIAQAAADQSELALQQARGALTEAESASPRLARPWPAIPTSRPIVTPTSSRRWPSCMRPSSTSNIPWCGRRSPAWSARPTACSRASM